MTQHNQSFNRPGCITAYAILAFVAGGLYLIGGIVITITSQADPGLTGTGLISAICFAPIIIVMGVGLWRMTELGWRIAIILNTLGLGIGLFTFFGSLIMLVLRGSDVYGTLGRIIIGLVINGYIVFWFLRNRTLFEGTLVYEKVVGPEGEIIEKPIGKSGLDGKTIAIIAAVFVFICLMPFLIISVLTLLGPQIGNVFSRITAGLGGTPMP